MANNWLKFWQEKNAFDDSMRINYNFFLRKVEKYVKPTSQSVVLDFGSGPGNPEDAWHSRVKEIHAVDISKRYNDIVREKYKQYPSVVVHDLPADDYLNLSFLETKKFDIMIVMSVLQYYRSKEEVVTLIRNVKKLAAPGSILLLCDLMVGSSFLKEIVEVLTDAFKQGKFFSVLKLFFNLRFSNYYKVKKETGFLVLSKEEWQSIINELQLTASFLDEPITLQKNRKNLLVKF